MELRGNSTRQLKIELKELERNCGNDLETFSKSREKLCSNRVKKLLFDKYLTKIVNENNGIKFDVLTYFNLPSQTTSSSYSSTLSSRKSLNLK
jgi:hypothetical protein